MTTPAGAWRRFAAMFYDGMVLFALLLVATAILMPFVGNVAIAPHHIMYQLYLLLIWFSFYAWFWCHKGQTLGMLAWGIQLVSDDDNKITFRQALIRFVTAFPAWLCVGMGFFWLFFNPDRKTWQDYLSHTRIVIK
ncbi:MAG: RDD family protein [Legionellales bacterium]|nr:RDD family protein [Legionellales bacterium]